MQNPKSVKSYILIVLIFESRRLQSGTLRTNCTDCLDRTNSVQTVFGLELLNAQLSSFDLGEISPSVAFRLSEAFKAMWANNGNELSKIYAGTGVVGTSSKVCIGKSVIKLLGVRKKCDGA